MTITCMRPINERYATSYSWHSCHEVPFAKLLKSSWEEPSGVTNVAWAMEGRRSIGVHRRRLPAGPTNHPSLVREARMLWPSRAKETEYRVLDEEDVSGASVARWMRDSRSHSNRLVI